MPFKSIAQQHYLHAHPDILGKKIDEWDKATDFNSLPKHVSKRKKEKPKILRHGSMPRKS